MLEEMAVPHGSRGSTEGSREEGILGTVQGEPRKLSDSGISSEEMGYEREEQVKGREGGWSWLVVLAG